MRALALLAALAPKVVRAPAGGIDWGLTVASIFVYGIMFSILGGIVAGVILLVRRSHQKTERERLAIEAERQRQARENPPTSQGYPPAGYPPPSGPGGYPPPGGYAPMMYAGPMSMFRCAMCGSTAPPLDRDKISVAGWVIFAILLFTCLPLCWVGLLQKDKYRVCAHCNTRLGGIG